MARLQLVAATRNPGKLAEIRGLLSRLDVTVRALDDYPGAPEPEETGATFARTRDQAVAAASFTGEVAVAMTPAR